MHGEHELINLSGLRVFQKIPCFPAATESAAALLLMNARRSLEGKESSIESQVPKAVPLKSYEPLTVGTLYQEFAIHY